MNAPTIQKMREALAEIERGFIAAHPSLALPENTAEIGAMAALLQTIFTLRSLLGGTSS